MELTPLKSHVIRVTRIQPQPHWLFPRNLRTSSSNLVPTERNRGIISWIYDFGKMARRYLENHARSYVRPFYVHVRALSFRRLIWFGYRKFTPIFLLSTWTRFIRAKTCSICSLNLVFAALASVINAGCHAFDSTLNWSYSARTFRLLSDGFVQTWMNKLRYFYFLLFIGIFIINSFTGQSGCITSLFLIFVILLSKHLFSVYLYLQIVKRLIVVRINFEKYLLPCLAWYCFNMYFCWISKKVSGTQWILFTLILNSFYIALIIELQLYKIW